MSLPAGTDVAFADLPGFAADGCATAFETFRRSALAFDTGPTALRPALPLVPGLAEVFAAARAQPNDVTDEAAAAFFRDHFAPWRLAADAFFTGYYEPVVDGAVARSDTFTAPLLARPPDLKTFAADEVRPDGLRGLMAARVASDGAFAPYPDRAAIEATIEAGGYRPLVWLRDWVEVFLIQVQGSARIRLPDGTMLRATYAGRNGHPYTSIGRILVASGTIPLEAMSLDRLKAWLRANGQTAGEAGRALMQRNASYVFFETAVATDDLGPTGGEGVRLTPLRSIAVDRTVWCYGLPFWVDVTAPVISETAAPFRRLMIAQDTGSAIVGPARVDLFIGSGEAAGRRAGDIRHAGALTVLLPRAAGPRP